MTSTRLISMNKNNSAVIWEEMLSDGSFVYSVEVCVDGSRLIIPAKDLDAAESIFAALDKGMA